MKKVLSLILFLVFTLTTACFASDEISEIWYHVNVRNETGELKDTLIPITTIRPKVDKLMGYDCMTLAPSGSNTETWVSIFDSTDSLLTGEAFGEQEATDGQESIHDRWEHGRWIFNGVSIRQGAYTDLLIYFKRR